MKSRVEELLNRFRAFLRKKPLDEDLDAEMAAHLDFAVQDNLRLGLSPEEARRRALLSFGGMEQAKERHRETRGLPALDNLMRDFRYAFRTLRRDRAIAMIAVTDTRVGHRR